MIDPQTPHADGANSTMTPRARLARIATFGLGLAMLSLAAPACSPCVASNGADWFTDAGTLTASDQTFAAQGSFGFAHGLHLTVQAADMTAPSDSSFEIQCPMSTDNLQPGVYDLATVCPEATASQPGASTTLTVTSLTGQLTVSEVSGVIDETDARPGDSGHFRGSIDITASVANTDGSNPQTWSARGVALVGDWNYQATSCADRALGYFVK